MATMVDVKAKTFSRSRAVEIIRNQYRSMKSNEESIHEYLELIKQVNDKATYERELYQAIARQQTAKTIIRALCDGFGIGTEEIDPAATAV